MSKLSEDLKQSRFENPQQRVLINVLYTSAFVKKASSEVLKPHGFTWQQFNLLRILRGQAGNPASMRLIQERMLDPQSNASRLVAKLLDKGLVSRETAEEDMRRVSVTLTHDGLAAIDAASDDMHRFLGSIGGALSDSEMRELSDGLDAFRDSLKTFIRSKPSCSTEA